MQLFYLWWVKILLTQKFSNLWIRFQKTAIEDKNWWMDNTIRMEKRLSSRSSAKFLNLNGKANWFIGFLINFLAFCRIFNASYFYTN